MTTGNHLREDEVFLAAVELWARNGRSISTAACAGDPTCVRG